MIIIRQRLNIALLVVLQVSTGIFASEDEGSLVKSIYRQYKANEKPIIASATLLGLGGAALYNYYNTGSSLSLFNDNTLFKRVLENKPAVFAGGCLFGYLSIIAYESKKRSRLLHIFESSYKNEPVSVVQKLLCIKNALLGAKKSAEFFEINKKKISEKDLNSLNEGIKVSEDLYETYQALILKNGASINNYSLIKDKVTLEELLHRLECRATFFNKKVSSPIKEASDNQGGISGISDNQDKKILNSLYQKFIIVENGKKTGNTKEILGSPSFRSLCQAQTMSRKFKTLLNSNDITNNDKKNKLRPILENFSSEAKVMYGIFYDDKEMKNNHSALDEVKKIVHCFREIYHLYLQKFDNKNIEEEKKKNMNQIIKNLQSMQNAIKKNFIPNKKESL